MTDPVYRGEALLRNWSETANGKRRIVFEIEDNGGAHPFKGLEGERFAVVVVGPLASDEHESLGGAEKGNRKPAGQPVHSKRSDGSEPPPATNSVTPVGGETGGSPSPLSLAPPVPKKRRWSEMPPSQRAALLTKEPEFWVFLNITKSPSHGRVVNEADADAEVKLRLGIGSKSELDGVDPREPGILSAFKKIEGEYQAFRQARGHGVI